MATINVNATANKVTRAEAVRYALDNLNNAPTEVVEVLEKVYKTFTKRPATTGETKTAKENKVLAERVAEFVNANFNPDDLAATNAKAIAENVPGITTTQKVVAVVKYTDAVKPVKVKGRTFYVPADTEVVE